MTALFSKDVWVVLGIVSGVFFIGTLIAIPILIVRLPNDYTCFWLPFQDSNRHLLQVKPTGPSAAKNLTVDEFVDVRASDFNRLQPAADSELATVATTGGL